MTMIDRSFSSVDSEATDAYAHLFHAFADSTRLAIVQHLASGEHRVRDLVEHMGFAQSTVSKHLSFLSECGLISARPDGRATWYALVHPQAVRDVTVAAEALLGATGKDFALCAHLRSEYRGEN
ncbi:ArsR/SmtB family transcription factor [Microbacterium sp. H83]|uniref:ArsR/SmtB family transcription factor n=1 Tax=Microbacterium sp. H83 TaxID=1827324 RepID=UPI0007F3D846|nr:metalloregulator ArsR/SmtB family transcription factor [Microbacterium sp. H83]OAN40948.1 transcriptional regulator [Microbacterium sp. H83]